MEIYTDKNGKILRFGRPYINQEETNRIWAIYNPNEGPFYGLYTKDPEYLMCGPSYYWPRNINRKPDFFLNQQNSPKYTYKGSYR